MRWKESRTQWKVELLFHKKQLVEIKTEKGKSRILAGCIGVCSVILFSTGYSITEYFHPEDMKSWTFLRNTLKHVVVILLIILSFLPRTSVVKGAMSCFLVIVLSDIIDRLVFDINSFVNSDYPMIVISVVIGVYVYAKDVQRIRK